MEAPGAVEDAGPQQLPAAQGSESDAGQAQRLAEEELTVTAVVTAVRVLGRSPSAPDLQRQSERSAEKAERIRAVVQLLPAGADDAAAQRVLSAFSWSLDRVQDALTADEGSAVAAKLAAAIGGNDLLLWRQGGNAPEQPPKASTLPLWLRPVCCPRAGCIAVLTASTAPASSFGGAAEKPHLTCPSCKASCCRVCMKAPHFPLPCDLAMDALHRLSVLRTLQRTLRPSVAQIVGVTQDMSDEDKGVIPRAELTAYSRVPCPRCGLVGTAQPFRLQNFELPHEPLVLHCAPCAASFCPRCGDSAHSQFDLFRGMVVCGRLNADFALTNPHGPLMTANQAREARALHVQSAQYGRVKNWFQELKDLAAARLPADVAPPPADLAPACESESKLNWKPKPGFSFDEPDSGDLSSSQTRFGGPAGVAHEQIKAALLMQDFAAAAENELSALDLATWCDDTSVRVAAAIEQRSTAQLLCTLHLHCFFELAGVLPPLLRARAPDGPLHLAIITTAAELATAAASLNRLAAATGGGPAVGAAPPVAADSAMLATHIAAAVRARRALLALLLHRVGGTPWLAVQSDFATARRLAISGMLPAHPAKRPRRDGGAASEAGGGAVAEAADGAGAAAEAHGAEEALLREHLTAEEEAARKAAEAHAEARAAAREAAEAGAAAAREAAEARATALVAAAKVGADRYRRPGGGGIP